MLASRVSAHVPTSAPNIKCTAAGRGINPSEARMMTIPHDARGGLNYDCKASSEQHSKKRIAAELLHRLDKGSVILEGLHRTSDMIKSEKDQSCADHG